MKIEDILPKYEKLTKEEIIRRHKEKNSAVIRIVGKIRKWGHLI